LIPTEEREIGYKPLSLFLFVSHIFVSHIFVSPTKKSARRDGAAPLANQDMVVIHSKQGLSFRRKEEPAVRR
jgi:hypothetical protein